MIKTRRGRREVKEREKGGEEGREESEGGREGEEGGGRRGRRKKNENKRRRRWKRGRKCLTRLRAFLMVPSGMVREEILLRGMMV